MRNTLLLVDLSNLFFKSLHSYGGLSHGGQSTAAVYGVMSQILSTVNVVGASDVLVCCDRKPYLRTRALPEYKERRKDDTPEEIAEKKRAMKDTMKTLEAAGILPWYIQGYEADDLIARAVLDLRRRYRRVVIKSNDSDLFQLFRYSSSSSRIMFARGGVREPLYTRKNFIQDHSIHPRFWVYVLALTGSHNNLPKVKGVGIKTAVKMLTQHEDGPDAAFKEIAAEEGNEFLRTNLKICTVPYPVGAASMPRASEHIVRQARLQFSERGLIQQLGKFGVRYSYDPFSLAIERLHGAEGTSNVTLKKKEAAR